MPRATATAQAAPAGFRGSGIVACSPGHPPVNKVGATCSAFIAFTPDNFDFSNFAREAAALKAPPGTPVSLEFYNTNCYANPPMAVSLRYAMPGSTVQDPTQDATIVRTGVTIPPTAPGQYSPLLSFRMPDLGQSSGRGSFSVVVAFSGTLQKCDVSSVVEGDFIIGGGAGTPAHPPGLDLAIDWQMPDRLTPQLMEQAGRGTEWGLPTKSYVDPPDWSVLLFVTNHGVSACPAGAGFDWTVSGEGFSKALPEHRCSVTAKVPKLGVYTVTARELQGGAPTGKVIENADVVVRDWLIVGMGDSNGSGEGNPPFIFPQCDRSLASSQYQTARYIEAIDPRSSVTLLLTSCSGARSEHLWQRSYPGTNPEDGSPLPPQIAQIQSLIGTRKVDAVIMSIGINDIYFSPLLTYCIKDVVSNCEADKVSATVDTHGDLTYHSQGSSTLAQATAARVSQLPNLYRLIDQHLAVLDPAHVFITDYPDFATNYDHQVCNGPLFSNSVWAWLEITGNALNSAVNATSSLGWRPITGIANQFIGHGYCSTDPYFRRLTEALMLSDPFGAFHATFTGQGITFAQTRPAVCEALYGNPTCSGKPPAPR